MNAQNSIDQLSENQSSISDISAKQQYNFQKLKQHSDFLANFVRDNNISLNDNPSVESKIMETPQRADIIGIKSGQAKSYVTSPPSQRTYQDGNKNIQNLIKEEIDYSYHDIMNKKNSNTKKKYQHIEESGRNSYQTQQQVESNELQNQSDIKLKGNTQHKDYQEDNYENEDDYHSKGHRVISTIDNIFNKMKTKYKMDFSLKEIQKHLNIPDSTAGNSANSSRQNFDSISQGDIALSQLNQNQRILQIQDSLDYESNPDSIVQKIKNKVLSRQGNQLDLQQEQARHNNNQLQQTTKEFKEKFIESKQNEIKKQRLSPSAQNKNSMNQIDEHDADMEIERIKTRIFNRNSETKKQEESPKKIEQVPNKKDNQRTQEIDTKETKKINKKHPIYNSSESSEEDVKTPKNIINPLQKTNKGVNNQIKTKNDKINQENDEESENKKNQKNLIPIKERNMQNEQIKNRKVEKQEDESLKALEQISQNKINFKENIKKLKQIFKNNFDLQKCKDEDEEGQDQIQQKADKQNQYQQNQNQIQYQQGRESELEYSQDHQNFFYDEDTITTKEHIIINDQSENFIGRRKPQSYSQQFGVDNDEIADMDSEVFNISPDHHPQNDHRLNSIPDENHTISIFNENQSLQASFLEQSIFQKSPRQSQAVSNSNNTFSQQINKRASPSPILNTQIQGQILQDSFNKNPQNHRQNNQKSVTQPLVQSLQTQSQSDNSQSYNKMSQGQINNLLVNRTQQYVQQDLQSSYQHNNASNLSYSQSMHEQSQINYNEPKKYQNDQQYQNYNANVGERILPLIEEEDEKLQKIYEQDPILQKLFQEKSGLEFELSKWENILQELNRQSSHLQ